jgi:transcriptional regulator with XRE-family HTH domain
MVKYSGNQKNSGKRSDMETPIMHNSPSMRIDGRKLRTLREGKFWTRDELAARVDMHRDSIGRLERGQWPGGSNIPTIRKLAEALGVDPHEIVADEED